MAIDTPNYLARRLSVIKTRKIDRVPTTHVHVLVTMLLSSLRNHILPVFVFDGPPEDLKRKANPELIQEAHELYHSWVSAPDLNDFNSNLEPFLSPALRMYFAAYHVKDICTAAGIPIVVAPSEAEMAAAALCRDGKVGTVVSNDADALLFGAPHVTRSVRLSNREIQRALLSDLRVAHDLDLEQMRDLAVICGCDFHKKGIHGMGPRKGAIALKRHGGLESLLRAIGLARSEMAQYIKARDVFDEANYLRINVDLRLQPPVTARVIRLIECALGHEMAVRRATEMLALWKNFGRVQMTLEGWTS